ncbi:MAG TPA: addiction module protein [Candidatus Baltobacteraceae bacterium]|nr:addiction module protein [Candidatus Baltobacteraceae bacterium]
MSVVTEQVFIEALSLPARERASLVHKLLVSLENEPNSPEIEEAWKQEALDRCAAFDAGKISERDAGLVLRDAYRKTK